MRQTAIRIKAEIAIPADTTDIPEFQAAVAKANQLKVLANEIGVVISFESKIGNVELEDEPEQKQDKPAPGDNSDRGTFPAEAMPTKEMSEVVED